MAVREYDKSWYWLSVIVLCVSFLLKQLWNFQRDSASVFYFQVRTIIIFPPAEWGMWFFFKVSSTCLVWGELYELLWRSHPVSSSGGYWRHCLFYSLLCSSCGLVSHGFPQSRVLGGRSSVSVAGLCANFRCEGSWQSDFEFVTCSGCLPLNTVVVSPWALRS